MSSPDDRIPKNLPARLLKAFNARNRNSLPPKEDLPTHLSEIKSRALRALGSVKPADQSTKADKAFLFNAKRTKAGGGLPPFYLVYFLLVDLLGFKNLGMFEKVSWSVPIDYLGTAYLIEHRKLGLGVFAAGENQDEVNASEIVVRITKAVKAAEPFFDWLAEEAVKRSELNVVNKSSELFQRYIYLRDSYREKAAEAILRKDERIVSQVKTWTSVSFPALRIHKEASWLALSAVEAFFSWTEHVLIHVAILSGHISSGVEVTALAQADWSAKFKQSLDIQHPQTKKIFDRLVLLRNELRNYVAHGAFGKQGEAFSFHSGAGAAPLLLPHKRNSRKFSLGSGLAFDFPAAIDTTEEFVLHLWSGDFAPAEMYIQQSYLPVFLIFAADGSYAHSMQSLEKMESFIDELTTQADRAANMDW